MSPDVRSRLDLMLSRRSIASLGDPAPTAEQLDGILAVAASVPDHGSLQPWRFVVVSGEGRAAFGDALAASALERVPDLPTARQDKVRRKAFLAPVLVVVIASPQPSDKVPEWEQVASASCSGYALVLAAHALGLGAVWKTADYLAGKDLATLLALEGSQRLLGWVAIGTPVKVDSRSLPERAVNGHAAVLDGPVLRPYR
jgi:nitroreductase